MIAKEILKWSEKKFDEALNLELDDKAAYKKAFVSGAVEGLVDAAVIIGGISIIKGWAGIVKTLVKKI